MTLTLDLVPSSTWYDNLRSRIKPPAWDCLRKATYAAAGHKCEVCGGKGHKWPVECHEIWDYNESKRVQRLAGLVALCPSCHEVKHFGRAQTVGRGRAALAHLMKVNRWTEAQAWEHINESFRVWERRSSINWTLDLSWLDRPEPKSAPCPPFCPMSASPPASTAARRSHDRRADRPLPPRSSSALATTAPHSATSTFSSSVATCRSRCAPGWQPARSARSSRRRRWASSSTTAQASAWRWSRSGSRWRGRGSCG